MATIEPLWPDDQDLGSHGTYDLFRMSSGHFYGISGTLASVQPDLTTKYRVPLTRFILDYAGEPDKPVILTTDNFRKAITSRPVSTREKAFRLMREIVNEAGGAPGRLRWGTSLRTGGHSARLRRVGCDLQQSEFKELLHYLVRQRWIELADTTEGFRIDLKAEGLIAFEEDRERVDSRICFVAMWFDSSMNDLYETGIAPAVTALGYEPFRVDRHEHNNRIDDEILAGIQRCRFMIADFTQGGDGARGGVYFEAGFAAGLGKPVVHTVRADQVDLLHFDTSHISHILWETPESLAVPLQYRIEATIGRAD